MKKNAQQSAVQYLAQRDHSYQELRLKLKTKGYEIDEVETVLQQLVQSGVLSDARFAENYTNSRRRKGYGPQRITLELKEKGVSSEVIAEALKIADNSWSKDAFQVWKKRFKGAKPHDFKERARQMQFLQYRGFTREQIDSVFD